MKGTVNELDDLIEAHNTYAQKRNEFEEYIKKVFEDNDVPMYSLTFNKNGFDVRCGTGYYLLDNFGKLMEAFPDYQLAFNFKESVVLFKFTKKL